VNPAASRGMARLDGAHSPAPTGTIASRSSRSRRRRTVSDSALCTPTTRCSPRGITRSASHEALDGVSVGSTFHVASDEFERVEIALDGGRGIHGEAEPLLSIAGVWKNANRPGFSDGDAIDPYSGAISRLEDYFVGGASIRPFGERITLSGRPRSPTDASPAGSSAAAYRSRAASSSTAPTRETWHGEERIRTKNTPAASASGSDRRARARKGGPCRRRPRLCAIQPRLRTDRCVRETPSLTGRVTPRSRSGQLSRRGGGFSLMGDSRNLHPLLRELESIRDDGDVKGLLLKVEPLSGASSAR